MTPFWTFWKSPFDLLLWQPAGKLDEWATLPCAPEIRSSPNRTPSTNRVNTREDFDCQEKHLVSITDVRGSLLQSQANSLRRRSCQKGMRTCYREQQRLSGGHVWNRECGHVWEREGSKEEDVRVERRDSVNKHKKDGSHGRRKLEKKLKENRRTNV
jgi:hypothetical protein